MSRSYYRQIALAPLGPEAIEELLADLLGSDPSLDGLSELIRGRTGGNPFFIEELVQALIEAGSLQGERGAYRLVAAVDEAAVPASVQAVLSARIDRLSAREKALLQAAAVIGKEFSQPVLERVIDLQPRELEDALRNLIAGEFVYEQELYPEALYAFKHPLTLEVAYGSQLRERRGRAHAAVATAIAELYPDRLEERAALVAGHWEAAAETLEAARWHARAAAWAGTTDPAEALVQWRRVRELADALPESAETTALGLTARIFLLHYGWRLGVSPEEAKALFSEAERIAAKAGDVGSRVLLLAAYGAIRWMGGGDVREWERLVRQEFALAEESGDPALYVANPGSPLALYFTGANREAVAICDRALELADGDPTVGAGLVFGCPYAAWHVMKGTVLVQLGELEEARRLIEQGRKIARERGDTEVVGISHGTSARLAVVQGEPEAALGHARQALEIAGRIGSSYSRDEAWGWLGQAEALRGQWRSALDALERSAAIARESRSSAFDALRLALLGESYLGLGDPERARALVTNGVETARAQGNVVFETLATLSLARVLLGSAGVAAREQIEPALARALQLVRETGAKVTEPLIHVELAELARHSGHEEERQRELREAHRLFSEIGASGHAERLAGELATAASEPPSASASLQARVRARGS
jgi:adenylate cyclase